VAVAALTLAARGVGGDFYDAALVDGRLAFVLGDVAGKGMAAGLIASSVHARWQAALERRDRDLAAMMLALNRDVFASTEGSRYATVFHGVLEPATGVLRYVNAGHPSGMIVASDGVVRSVLAPTSPAVGLMDTADFTVADCRLERHETLLVVSDGVTEALDETGRELDLSLLASLAARPHADVQVLADAVVDAVRRHRGGDQSQDDVTVLAIRRTS
jgi:phosphoserine phosphatase RsbU/P